MNVNWTSLLLVLFGFLNDCAKILAGAMLASGRPTSGAILAAAGVALGSMSTVFAQNQPKPGVSQQQDTGNKGAP